ncbi:MAG: haloacid dehalogenase type II [Rhizobiaceae bacterium]
MELRWPVLLGIVMVLDSSGSDELKSIPTNFASFQISNPKAYIFDVFGTVVDWRNSVARIAARTFDTRGIEINGFAFADFWRGQYVPAMARIRSGNRGYVSLDQLHYENLEATLLEFKLEAVLNKQEKWQLNSAWERLDPWPGVASELTQLKQKAIIAPCSNGSIALMTRLARHGNLPWDCILGADLAQNYKPEPAVYLACCKALRLEPDEVMMVAAHNNDLVAAQNCKLQTAFIARPTEHGSDQSADLVATGSWDRIVTSFSQL